MTNSTVTVMQQGGSWLRNLERDLIRDEGLNLEPYHDSVGVLTIGVGRNLEERGITKDEALFMLGTDVSGVLMDLDRNLPWWRKMDEPRRRALANMCFNLGINRLLKFKKMLAALEAGDYERAAVEALDSKWAKQVGARSQRIAALMKGE